MKTAEPMPTQKVLDHFGLKETDIEALDPYVDWKALEKSIDNPTKSAVCNILDAKGNIVMSERKPAKVIFDVPVANTFKEELEKRSLKFVEWWD